ncbi:hypothetical protein RvY_03390 [Ramazzottius varieornatus]|uniref:Uncharacterized protein n=1 Tax=Ramazzottius varieornatus TaxID=947166 RepID=A0A1D1UMY3_RAMVA|nr:hypothetical protein RvY_03390 [Ramazzottius varieornatus]
MMEDRECVRMRDTTLAKRGVTGISQVSTAERTAYLKIAEEVMFIKTGNLDALWKSHLKDLPILHVVALQNIWTPFHTATSVVPLRALNCKQTILNQLCILGMFMRRK